VSGARASVAVAGATGFVGRALVARLAATHDVVALARRAPILPGARGIAVDVGDEEAATAALEGCEAAYYLVHSLEVGDFATRDRELATAFGGAAARAGVGRIVYLGGLGHEPSSAHLRSRQEVGGALGAGGVPVVELRAAVVLGAGSISFEMLRYLTERLPFMVCPRWVRTAIQPIALDDALEYLVRALQVAPGTYEIGGAEVTTYREMIEAYAKVRGLRRRLVLDVPVLTPRLSSYWVDLVTPVDRRISHALVDSLVTEVVVTEAPRTASAFGITPLGVEDALRTALDAQCADLDAGLLERGSGLLDGVYTERVAIAVTAADASRIDEDFDRIGGDLGWYGLAAGWRVRMALGRLFGERWPRRRARVVAPGESVDWWVVVRRAPGELVLRATGWLVGEGWLAWRVEDGELVEVGALRPRGVPGFVYWKVLEPLHRHVFARLARHRVARVRRSPD